MANISVTPQSGKLILGYFSRRLTLAVTGLLFVGFILFLRYTGFITGRFLWVAILFAPVVLVAYYLRETFSRRMHLLFLALLIGLTGVFGGAFVFHVINESEQPSEWDFLGFWMHSSLAVNGHNFYDPQMADEVEFPYEPSPVFVDEIMNVGFWYPPPSMMLFAPLGFFESSTAHRLWHLVNGFIIIGCAYLLWKTFLDKRDVTNWLFVLVLLLMLPLSYETIIVSQTNFLVLLLLLLFWRDQPRARAGLWIAIGIFVKPYIAVVMLIILLTRSWRVFASTLVSAAVLCAISIVLFGADTFISYFQSNPASAIPNYVYLETGNQSLLSTIIRANGFGSGSVLFNPLFLGIAGLLGIATVFAVWRNGKDILSLALVLVLGLLVYPASLFHYGVILIIPILALWKHRNESRVYSIVALALTIIIYLLGQEAERVFVVNLMVWILLFGVTLWRSGQQRRVSSGNENVVEESQSTNSLDSGLVSPV